MRTSLVAMVAVLAALACPVLADAPASQPAVASKPAEKDGLSVTVRLPKATFAADEPVRFVLRYTNVSDKPMWLYDAEWFWDWRIQFEDVKTGGPWRLRALSKVTRVETNRELKAGEVREVEVNPAATKLPFDFVWEGIQTEIVGPIKQLAPGKYRLTVQIHLVRNPKSMDQLPWWQGQITTDPVEFEIAPASASAPAGKPG